MPSFARMRLAVTNSSIMKSSLLIALSSTLYLGSVFACDLVVAAAGRGTQRSICGMANNIIAGDFRMLRRRAIIALFATTLAVGAAAASARAGDFPDHPIRVIVSVPAGGGVDTVTRIVTDRMRAVLGQPLVVENKPGVSGSLAAEAVFHAEPDGYTILASQPAPITTNSFLYKALNYDPAKLVPL